jgi:anaerobic magnesium-protoporphyrin IX monomethyl ester cyclase
LLKLFICILNNAANSPFICKSIHMNILIINPPIRLSDKPRHIPHGLAIIANIIRKKLGTTPRFLDLNALRLSDGATVKAIAKEPFDVVLIGGLIPVYKRIIKLAAIVKKINPRAIVVAGGSAAMSAPETLLAHSDVDVVCAGEGEQVVVELLCGLSDYPIRELTGITGFYFKIGDDVIFSGSPPLLNDLDLQSDIPAYDLLPMEIYLANPVVGMGRDIDFISSRGCPFKCTFCYQPWGRKFRGHSVPFIIDALKYLHKIYAVEFISFQDDEFMAKRNRVFEFCDAVKSALPGLRWSCTGRVNLVEDEIVGVMREAGCVSISYGFESGSPRMLKSMKKGVTVEQMEEAVRLTRKHKMMLPVSFIIGMPGENEESCRETVELCVRNNLPLKSMMFATPYPGAPLFDYAVGTGRIPSDRIHEFIYSLGDARDFTVNLTDSFTDYELVAKREAMITEVMGRITPLSSDETMARMKHLFGELITVGGDEADIRHRAEHGGLDIF